MLTHAPKIIAATLLAGLLTGGANATALASEQPTGSPLALTSAVQRTAVQNVRVSYDLAATRSTILRWDAVPAAAGYQVTVANKTYRTRQPNLGVALTGGAYTARVQAVAASGERSWATVYHFGNAVPQAVSSVKVTNTAGQLKLSWQRPAGTNRYLVSVRGTGKAGEQRYLLADAKTTVSLPTGTKAQTSDYRVSVRAFNDQEQGTYTPIWVRTWLGQAA